MSYNPVPKLTNGNATFDNDLNVSGISTFDAGIKTPLNTIVDGATITFDMDSSNNHSVILGGNRTLAVSNVDAGQKFTIRLKQDSAGNRSPVWWGGITWLTSNGSDPTLKTGGGEIDYFGFISTSGGYYEGFHLTEAGGGGGGGSSTMTVKEADGTPSVSNVSTIVVSNGTLTNDGGGQVTITTGGGGGGSYDDTYISGVSTFASGLAIQNQADIATVSGLLYDDTAISGYFESRVDQADSDITTISGLIPPNTFDITGGDGTNYTIDAMGLNSASDPTMYLHKGHTYIFNKTFSGHPFRISDTDGGSVYQDADGNNIEIGSSAGAVTFEVPQDAPDKLYYYCTAHPSTMKGVIYTTADGATSGYFESRVDQADTDIATVSGLLYDDTAISGYFESRVDANQAAITSNDADIAYLSGIAVYGSGHTLQTVTDNGASTTNAVTITNNNITASSGLFDSLDMTPLAEANYPAHQEGVVFYDADNHTLSLYNDEADVTLQLGQEEFLRVRNNTGATINNGTAVLITGSHGNAAPTISGAIATSESTSQIVGLATHSIEDSSFGYVTTYGIVRNVDTSHCAAGDEIFLSATEVGSGVNVSPTIPNYKVTIGHVIRSHGDNGSILVQIGHAKLGGGDLKSEAELNLSGVPFVTTKSNTTAGGSQTDPLFIFDSGNRQLQLGSGLQLLDGVPSNTSNVLYNNAGTLSFNGAAVDTNTTYSTGSGLTLVGTEFNVYGGSGNFEYVELTTDNNVVPTFKFLGSGATDTPINLEVRSSLQSATGSGTALLFQGTQGQLFSITDNLSSGTIFNVSDITGLPMLEVTASGDVEIGEFADNITIHQPVLLSGGVPSNTTNKLYNNNGSLYFNGSALGGGSSYTAGSGLTLVGTEFNVYGGSGHFANLEIKPNVTTDTGLIVQSISSQTANLQEWQNSSENTLSHVDTSGVYTNIIGSSGTDILRVQYGDAESNQTVTSNTDIKGVWLDFEDGSEYTAGTVNGNALLIGTWYNTAKTIPSRIKIGATSFNVSLANSQKIDVQGTTTKFNTDVVPFTTVARDLGTTSLIWRNLYASGITVSGVELTNHVPLDTTNRLYNDGGTLKFNGSDVGGGSSYTAGSGLTLAGTEFNVYGGSGNFENIDLTTDGTTVPKMVFTGSGVTDTPIRMKVLSSHASASTSGTALSFEGTEGQLFGLTDNLSSGTIFSVNDITGLPMIEVDASGDVKVGRFANSVVIYSPSVSGSVQGDLNVTGAFTATTKSFLIDHPTKEGMKLQYASLEGPENGVYIRGTSGSNIITLPEYWSTLVDQSTVTVSLTPIGYYQALYIEEKGKNYIKVGGSKGSYDYVVYGERKDVEKLKVEW